MLQPSTKALAQMLAGNTKSSGQLAHARNVLAQANRMVDERLADRLSPAAREQFFEQLAILRLTITDAEEAGLAEEMQPETPVRQQAPIDVDRLREVALRLATAQPLPQVPLAALRSDSPEDFDEGEQQPGYAPARVRVAGRRWTGGCRGAGRHGSAPRAAAAQVRAAHAGIRRLIGRFRIWRRIARQQPRCRPTQISSFRRRSLGPQRWATANWQLFAGANGLSLDQHRWRWSGSYSA